MGVVGLAKSICDFLKPPADVCEIGDSGLVTFVVLDGAEEAMGRAGGETEREIAGVALDASVDLPARRHGGNHDLDEFFLGISNLQVGGELRGS